jgi:hypothetical protein
MEKVTEHLYCTSPDFPFGDNTWKTCAYLLCRKDGNLIVYSSSKFKEEETQLRTCVPANNPQFAELMLELKLAFFHIFLFCHN